MSASLRFNGEPFQYKTEPDAGVSLTTGERWWGTRVYYRPGIRGRWLHFVAIDVHPLEHKRIEAALRAWLERNYTIHGRA